MSDAGGPSSPTAPTRRGQRGGRLRQALRPIGVALTLIAIAWIGWRFAHGGSMDVLASLPLAPTTLAGLLAAAAFGYAVAMLLPAIAWWRLAQSLGRTPLPAGETIAAYAVTQFGKYIPGNVAHYALRHAWSRRRGLGHADLVLASMFEAMLFVAAALAVTGASGVRAWRIAGVVDARLATALVIAGLAVGVVAFAWLVRRRAHAWRFPRMPAATYVVCAVCYTAFFVACGVILSGLAMASGVARPGLALAIGAGTASWIAGFVVVGSPAGIGVREATFIALAAPALGASPALVLIGFYRIVTFAGDTLFLLAGSAYLKRRAARSRERGGEFGAQVGHVLDADRKADE